ncbi:hypothetical protein BUH_1697 [Burkholderia pseudomallei Pakistan 9]|nr:hypothetical protein BUH_1697 [Burkholderia pseudomallei Pakistan 9]
MNDARRRSGARTRRKRRPGMGLRRRFSFDASDVVPAARARHDCAPRA